ncbi:MAG: high-affinity nickel-transporter [Chloroflexi bacterium]|nr:high-affinity nickel-transporter [Chloroflexota bacterium]
MHLLAPAPHKPARLYLRLILLPVLALGLFFDLAAPAWGHPLGNFTINHYSRIEMVAGGVIHISYVLDMAEIPTFQEMARIDSNHDGQVSDAEHGAYLDQKITELRRHVYLVLDGAPLPLKAENPEWQFVAGQGGLQTIRLTTVFTALPAVQGQNHTINYRDENDADRLGWREILVRPQDGITLSGANIPTTDQSDELRTYPQDMLASPLDRRALQFSFTIAPGVLGTSAVGPATASQVARPQDGFASLITTQELSLPVLLLSLLAAMFWGAAHSLSPGHGKTVVAAYLVGSRGTPRHALFLGLTTTITHTAGVFALGLITLFASQFILPERLFPWLSLISGILVVVIGLNLFFSRIRGADLRQLLPWRAVSQVFTPAGQRRQSGPGSDLHFHAAPVHDFIHQPHHHTHHDDDHHAHDHDEHPHTYSAGSEHHGHTHLPPGGDGAPLTWRSLLALGISGGLLPCPSALVVLLSAIALNRVFFGLLLVLVFSIGLAGALTGIGLLLVFTGRFFEKLPIQDRFDWGILPRLLPAASALIIVLLGLGITIQALLQTNVIHL